METNDYPSHSEGTDGVSRLDQEIAENERAIDELQELLTRYDELYRKAIGGFGGPRHESASQQREEASDG